MVLDIERAWFCYEDRAGQPYAVVTTSDDEADEGNPSPVASVVNRYVYVQWQSPTHEDWLQIDFGSDVTLQCFCIVFPRITNPYRRHETQEILSTDTIRHLVDAEGGTPGTGNVLDTGTIQCGALPTRGYSVVALATPITGRYWRCHINAASRETEGFFLVGLAMAGPIFQPSFNHIWGERIGFPDNVEIQRTPSSQTTFVTRNEPTLSASMIWDFIPTSERAEWEAMAEYAGTSEPIVFAIANPDAAPFTSDQGPNGWVMEGKRVFVGLADDDLSLTSRQLNANIKQLQMTEHR